MNMVNITSVSSVTMVTDDPDTDSVTLIEINIVYAIVVPIVVVIGTVLNLTTILAFWKLPGLRDKPGDLLILNLSFVDLITAMIFLPASSFVYITPGYWPLGETGCRVVTAIMNTTIHGSLFALIAISLDRFLLVYLDYPKYIKTQTFGRIYFTIAMCWSAALATVVIEQGLWDEAKRIDITAASIPFDKLCLVPPRRIRWFSLTYFGVLFFLPVVVVCSLSTAFLWQLRKRLKKSKGSATMSKPRSIQVEMTSTTEVETASKSNLKPSDSKTKLTSKDTRSSNQTRNLYIKPAVTLLGLVLSMAICMLPYCFYVLIIELGCQLCNDTDILYALILLQFCNAALDPFIYMFTRKKVRQFYGACFCKCRLQCNINRNELKVY